MQALRACSLHSLRAGDARIKPCEPCKPTTPCMPTRPCRRRPVVPDLVGDRALETRQPRGPSLRRAGRRACADRPASPRTGFTLGAVRSRPSRRAPAGVRSDPGIEHARGPAGHCWAGRQPGRRARLAGRPPSPVASCWDEGAPCTGARQCDAPRRAPRPGPELAAPASVTPPIANMAPTTRGAQRGRRLIFELSSETSAAQRSLLEPQSRRAGLQSVTHAGYAHPLPGHRALETWIPSPVSESPPTRLGRQSPRRGRIHRSRRYPPWRGIRACKAAQLRRRHAQIHPCPDPAGGFLGLSSLYGLSPAAAL